MLKTAAENAFFDEGSEAECVELVIIITTGRAERGVCEGDDQGEND